MRVAILSSGGKDSSKVWWTAQCKGWDIVAVVTVRITGEDSYMFQIPTTDLVGLQAISAGVKWVEVESSGEQEVEIEDLKMALAKLEIDGIVVGAIRSDYQKSRLERMTNDLGINIWTPIWHQDPEKHMTELITADDINELSAGFSGKGDKLDVVVFAAPQLSIFEMQQLAEMCRGIKFKVPVIVCTAPQVIGDSNRMGFTDAIEAAGGTVLVGTCFYQQYAREIGEANGWVHLLSNSTKIVNILSGYGYKPALANMEKCVASAVAGVVL